MKNNIEKFNKKKFKELLKTKVFGRNFLYFFRIGSTNDYAAELLDNSPVPELESLDGTLILAEIQTSSRGRFERPWLSPRGGLWFSLIFMADIRPEELPNLTLITAFSVAEVLIENFGMDVIIKWPNDLYSGKYKFGGILSELKKIGSLQMIILGIGLNVNNDVASLNKLNSIASTIQNISGKVIDRELLLAQILKSFERSYKYFSNTGDFKSIFKKMENILRYQ